MNKLTIKSGCVEAEFKRGGARTKAAERKPPVTTDLPLAQEAANKTPTPKIEPKPISKYR